MTHYSHGHRAIHTVDKSYILHMYVVHACMLEVTERQNFSAIILEPKIHPHIEDPELCMRGHSVFLSLGSG